MPLPCACDGPAVEWPYEPDVYPVETHNGVRCGDDGSGGDTYWMEPPGDRGAMVATKASAAGITTGVYQTLGAGFTEQAGAARFDGDNVFTANREGIYKVTFSARATAEAYSVWMRVVSNYAPWSSPYLELATPNQAVWGGGNVCAGLLPCADGGTLTFTAKHDRGSNTTFTDIYIAVVWFCPIPS